MTQHAEVQWYCGGHSNMDPFRSVFNAASKEKEDFIILNDRLSDLFLKLEKMRGGQGSGCEQYLKTIACLEEEIKKLRMFYDAEMSKQRREIAILCAEKSEMTSAAEKMKTLNATLMQKLDDEQKENQRRRDEAADLTCRLTQKEHEAFELTKYVACLKSQLALMAPKLEKYEREVEVYSQQLTSEKKTRQDFEDKHEQLVAKLNFDTRQHEQQMRDVEQRLSNAYKLIEELNEKLRRLSDGTSGRGSVAQLLQKIREQLTSEFERYRCDTEESMKRTLSEMKTRLDQRLRENQRLQEEKDRLEDFLAKTKGELNQIQSQLGAANECNQQLQVALQNEKLASAATSRNFEGKLADIEDCMMQKVREVATARDVQTGLRIELNSLKSMIENEEERINGCLPPVPCGPPSVIYATQGFPNRNVGCHASSTAPPPTNNTCQNIHSNKPASTGGQLASARIPKAPISGPIC